MGGTNFDGPVVRSPWAIPFLPRPRGVHTRPCCSSKSDEARGRAPNEVEQRQRGHQPWVRPSEPCGARACHQHDQPNPPCALSAGKGGFEKPPKFLAALTSAFDGLQCSAPRKQKPSSAEAAPLPKPEKAAPPPSETKTSRRHSTVITAASEVYVESDVAWEGAPSRRSVLASAGRTYTLYLIRHGEATHNIKEKEAKAAAAAAAESRGVDRTSPECLQAMEEARKTVLEDDSLLDAPLSADGKACGEETKAQLEALVSELRLPAPTSVLVSPLQRTLQTAALVFPSHGDVCVREELRGELVARDRALTPAREKQSRPEGSRPM